MANNFTKTMRQALQEAREYRDTTEGGPGSGPQKGGKKFSSSEIKKAYGILNDPRYKQGNYTGAAKAINKLAPGLADHPDVKNAMKRANENLDLPATGDTTTSNASQEVEQVEEESTDEMFSTRSLGLKGASKRSRDKAREKDKDSEKSKKKEDLDEAKFTPAQISALQKAYAPLKGKTDYKSATGSKMNFNKLKNKMKSYSVSHLQQLSVADIPMVSDAAKELMKEESITEAWQYEMDIEYGDNDDRLIVFGNIRGANLETQADRAYDKLEKEMEKKFGRDIAIEGGVFKGKTNDRSRGVSATGKVDPRESDPIQRKDI